jgi:signal transduction histidine kinase
MTFFSSLRFRLQLLVLLAVIPILGMTLYAAIEDRQRQIAHLQTEASQIAEIVSAEEYQLVRGVRQLLVALAQLPQVRDNDGEACGAFLAELIGHYRRYANLALADSDGNVFCSAVPVSAPVNLADQISFQRALHTPGFSIGDYQVDRITNEPTISFAYPALDENGQKRAVVYAALDLDWFNQLQLELRKQLSLDSVLINVDGSGVVLVHEPDPEKWVGRSMLDHPLIQAVLDRGQGVVEADGLDGTPGIYAFAPVSSEMYAGDIYVIIGASRDFTFGETNRTLRRNLVGLGLVTVLALVAAWLLGDVLILRPVNALLRTATQLSEGDLGARADVPSGRGELVQLAQALDRMAEALEQREIERRRAERTLRQYAERLVEIQERERRHIARELHDEVGQSLTAVKMNLQAAQRLTDEPTLVSYQQDCIDTVERTLHQVRSLSLDLRPSVLDDLGLEPALRWLVARQVRQTGLSIQLDADLREGRLPPDLEIACFRVVQEALTNAVRHAEAEHVWVDMRRREDVLLLVVRNDGVEFDVKEALERAAHGESLGLLGMKERVSLAGGQIEIVSAPGRGSEIRARFPVGQNGGAR